MEATMTEVRMTEAVEEEEEEIVGGNRHPALARFLVVLLKIQKHGQTTHLSWLVMLHLQ